MTNYRVYVIQNPEGRHHIGLSEDVEKRLNDHNSGVSTWTRHRGPWLLVWMGPEQTLSEARKLERELKAQKGGQGFYQRTGLQKQPGS